MITRKFSVLFITLFIGTSIYAQDDIESDIADFNYCMRTTASAVVPKKIDQYRELIAVRCEEKKYLGRPTFAYTFKVTDSDFEKQLRSSFDEYRTNFFQNRCRNQDGTYNRSNYRAIYEDRNKRKIAELFISYYECIGAYDDNITGGLGAYEALKQLEKMK